MTRKYRSKFEENVGEVLGNSWQYEASKYEYSVPRKYIPDFEKGDTWIEVKGYFRAGDVAKYKAIRSDHLDKRLVLVFSDPNKKVRKGAKLTMGDWGYKNNWEWTTLKEIQSGTFKW